MVAHVIWEAVTDAILPTAKADPWEDGGMTSPKRPDDTPRNPWKRKMGVEFSGLEGPSDFLIAVVALALFIGVAMVIAFVAFG